MFLERLIKNLRFLNKRKFLTKILILSIATATLVIIHPENNKILSKEIFDDRMSICELNYEDKIYFDKSLVYNNSNSVSKTIAIYGNPEDLNFFHVLASSLEKYPIKIILNGDKKEKGYFAEIFLDFDSEEPFIKNDVFKSYQPNSDIFFVASKLFKQKINFDLKELILYSHVEILAKQFLELLMMRFKEKINFLSVTLMKAFNFILKITKCGNNKIKNNIYNDSNSAKNDLIKDIPMFIFNPNKLYISISKNRDDLKKIVFLVRCICNMESYSLGSYYYLSLGNTNINPISILPFIIIMAIYLLHDSIFDKSNINYSFVLLIFSPLSILLFLRKRALACFKVMIFTLAINFKVSFIYSLSIFFREIVFCICKYE
ncbi:hypothetical protein DMUE_1262 [Dictyocoela muelleri]|nr:hypothetical protein DMUE_1262 [Dictyocoela muelleri]